MSRGICSRSRGAVAGTVTSLLSVMHRAALVSLAGIPDMQSQNRRVNSAVTPKEQSAKNGFGQDVEDSVEDGLGVGGDDVAAFGQTPGNWVEEPEEDSPDAADQIGLGNFGSESLSMFAALEDDGPGDEEEGGGAEDEEAPFVGRFNQSADQAGYDHDFVKEDGVENGWSW